jgi:ubiquinone/menaquinone biosynthesis C-methylase UbiE
MLTRFFDMGFLCSQIFIAASDMFVKKMMYTGTALLTTAFFCLVFGWGATGVHSFLALGTPPPTKSRRMWSRPPLQVATAPFRQQEQVEQQQQGPPPPPIAVSAGEETGDASATTLLLLNEIAKREDAKFRCDESVEFWRQFSVVDDADGRRIIRNVLQPYINGRGAGSGDASTAAARAYWLYHALRVGYFASNALSGLLAFRIHEAVTKRTLPDFSNMSSLLSSSGSLLLSEAFLSMDQNWKWVEQGVLNYPWDATIMADTASQQVRLQLDHKQANPLFALTETTRLIQDSISIWGRRTRLEGKSAGVWLDRQAMSQSGLYPSYYLNDFHYQQDGWMSSTSAERYEVATETLFLGRQDSMQRQTLVPIRKKYRANQSSSSPPPAPPRAMLEVACGTGRFATFARDNFPTTNMTLVDLSPFYLEKAKEHDRYWRSQRGREAMKIATGAVNQDAPDTTQFVIANAERLPFPDNSFDVVTTVYLFHELPHSARVNVAAEMARVCQPGGMVVLSDSMQMHDRPLLQAQTPMSAFAKLNEPHYESYLNEDLSALFEAQGLVPDEKYMNSRTKTLSFVKKAED